MDRRLVRIVDPGGVEPHVAQPVAILWLAAGREDTPAPRLQPLRRIQPDLRLVLPPNA